MLDEDKLVALFASQYWLMRKINRMNKGERAVLVLPPPPHYFGAALGLCVVLLGYNLMSWAVLVLWGAAINDF